MYYTKYRPQKFNDVEKPSEVVDAILNQLSSSKTAHAYLFVGTRGTGKTTIARLLAKALNCENLDKNGDVCNKCSNCKSINSLSFVDLIEIDAASNRGINDIRDLREKVKLAPSVGKHKVYIIDEVHMLTKEAFNALLKTLEEPPANTTFILCTTEGNKIPDTIKSRCQVFKFKKASVDQIANKLKKICKSENITDIAEGNLLKIAKAANGGFRDAENILQQVVEGKLDIDSFVGLSSDDVFFDFVECLEQNNTSKALRIVSNLVDDGLDLRVWVYDLINFLREVLYQLNGVSDITSIFDFNEEQKKKIEQFNIKSISKYLKVFVDVYNQIPQSIVESIPLEVAIVDLTAGSSKVRNEEILNDDPLNDEDKERDQEEYEEVVEGGNSDSDSNSNYDLDDFVDDLEEEFNREFSQNKDQEVVEKDVVSIDDDKFFKIKEKWSEILDHSIKYNHSLHAMLKNSSVKEIKNGYLIIEVCYKFHKERLESDKNRRLVEQIIFEVTDINCNIACDINEKIKPKKLHKNETGDLTDYNIEIPAVTSENISEIFDGALPL